MVIRKEWEEAEKNVDVLLENVRQVQSTKGFSIGFYGLE